MSQSILLVADIDFNDNYKVGYDNWHWIEIEL